jgi:hypothetical protein
MDAVEKTQHLSEDQITEQLRANYAKVKEIIQAQDFLERVPAQVLEFSPAHLEDLVKFAYFAGFIQLGQARQLLLLKKDEIKPRLRQWYEDIREKGCWLC